MLTVTKPVLTMDKPSYPEYQGKYEGYDSPPGYSDQPRHDTPQYDTPVRKILLKGYLNLTEKWP